MRPVPALAACFLGPLALLTANPAVTLIRTPADGLQPQVAAAADGTAHLVFFRGAPEGGDLLYARAEPGATSFSAPLRVNTQAGSAVATGTIRGAQLAVGRNGRVHVVWNGNPKLMPEGHARAPLLYTRLDEAGTAFEPERNVITSAYGLDGGSSVAADDAGNVYAVWHGQPGGVTGREETRALFVARSADDGATFAPEEPVVPRAAGVCPCCGLKAWAGSGGTVAILYRLARGGANRDSTLLLSRDGGTRFETVLSDPWPVAACPMSSATLGSTRGELLAAWETAGQVQAAVIDPVTAAVLRRFSAPGQGRRKHPVIVANAAGDVLLAWAEGTGWRKGGKVAWQVFGPDGEARGPEGSAEGLPVWGLATAFARPDGSFTVIF